MSKRLFLLDGMALAYRAHFAFAGRPIRTSQGLNTSALFGFTMTLLDIVENWEPTHLAAVFDTAVPTQRHIEFPAYKAQREEMPEDLSAALPHLRRLIGAFHIRVVTLDGFEADDLIGTLVKRAEPAGFETLMVTPDKDFGQLVTDRSRLWKPGRQGGDPEILGPAEVCARWGLERVEQVVDLLGLMGDASDNIPGVPGIGEKTAAKLLAQFGTLDAVLAHAGEVKGRIGEALREHAEQARLSRRLATINTEAPLELELDQLALRGRDDESLKALCAEFEFNAIGRRLFGEAFKAGRGGGEPKSEIRSPKSESSNDRPQLESQNAARGSDAELDLFGQPVARKQPKPAAVVPKPAASPAPPLPGCRTLADTPHDYERVDTPEKVAALALDLAAQRAFCFDTETDGLNPQTSRLLGIAFSCSAGRGWYVPVSPPVQGGSMPEPLAALAGVFANEHTTKVGHNLKFDLLMLRWNGVTVGGPLFDTMIAHALLEPDQRHGMDYCSEVYLNYSPIPIERLIGPKGPAQRSLAEVPVSEVAVYSAEDADVTWQLHERFIPLLRERGLERVFYEVEMPVLPAIAAMEFEGVQVDPAVLGDFSAHLAASMAEHESAMHRLAGREFNVNSNKQLGEIFFDELKLADKPKKTPSGQYATDEQTLQTLAGAHEIVRRLLDYRMVAKLKSTYADALPAAISPRTGRVHTTFYQAATATGRLSSQDPNLQNIPIRTDLGQEIRKAFVARRSDSVGAPGWKMLSADYSQIELRILASISHETAMIEAFKRGEDIHSATAARVFNVMPELVLPEQRRRAKMVNFGIAYGISAFGLAQRLGIPRGEAATIIEQYFASYPGIRRYMDETIATARERGWVQTLTGRRRALPDVRSANGTVRGAAERNAINTPIQGTAADMIKLAMANIHAELDRRGLRSRMVLQVHDELVFDLFAPEEDELRALVEDRMKSALPLEVPLEVEIGVGANWLEAH